jgi:predicted molibdopterin-dependent oxidoreductase YjgC
MFKRLPEAEQAAVVVTIDGEPFRAREGDSVAAALVAAGRTYCRETPVSAAKRGPYCMMGACFDCLVIVDGVGNRQGCLVRVRDGMRIEIQRGKLNLCP